MAQIIGAVAGSVLGGTANAKGDNQNGSAVSQAQNISNANAQGTPQMIQPVFTPAQSKSPRNSDTEWERLADMAKSLYNKNKEEKPVEKKEAPSANASNTAQ